MDRIIIGFSGAKGAGKDTAADWFVTQHGFVKMAYADALKAAVEAIMGIPTVMDWQEKERIDPYWNISPRQAWQWFGTEACRVGFGNKAVQEGAWTKKEAQDIWIKALMRAIDRSSNKRVVVTDVRFDGEATAILDRGGLMVDVFRPGVSPDLDDPLIPLKRRLRRLLPFFMKGTALHSSEDGINYKVLHRRYPGKMFWVTNVATEGEENRDKLHAQLGHIMDIVQRRRGASV